MYHDGLGQYLELGSNLTGSDWEFTGIGNLAEGVRKVTKECYLLIILPTPHRKTDKPTLYTECLNMHLFELSSSRATFGLNRPQTSPQTLSLKCFRATLNGRRPSPNQIPTSFLQLRELNIPMFIYKCSIVLLLRTLSRDTPQHYSALMGAHALFSSDKIDVVTLVRGKPPMNVMEVGQRYKGD